MNKRVFRLINSAVRQRAIDELWGAPDGYEVVIKEPGRNLDQSARFHAICGEFEKLRIEWAGKPRTKDEWKNLLVSGHSVATKEDQEIVEGLEGEFVQIRESTALMGKRRASSLIEYSQAMLETMRP